jgi:hypothetical protein
VAYKRSELALLERTLRARRVPHYSTTTYARSKCGAPDVILSSDGAAVWLLGRRGDISPRQAQEQAMLRRRGWRVLTPETSDEALKEIGIP